MATDNNLHFVLFPLMAQGHMIPMVDMARILAHRGATVSIATTPLLANRVRGIVTRAKLKIQLLELPLPLDKVGLPQGFESLESVPPTDIKVKLFEAMDLLQQPIEQLFRGLCPPPSCIISDSPFTWTQDVARKFNIPRLVFYGPGCFWLVCKHLVSATNILEQIESDSERFVIPGLPDRIEVTKLQFLGTSKTISAKEKLFRDRFQKAERDAYGIVVNSFNELEPEYAQELARLKHKKVWCIGPVSLCNKDNKDLADRGNRAAVNESDCLKWLDAKEPGSVIYVGLGSLAHVSSQQGIELGLGLEATNRPFVWCIRKKTEELEKWFSEEGFEERVKDRGLIVHGWAPQVLILSHRAVGGFLTHCGWNSTLESVCAGVPMVTWPHFADQFLNEAFIVDIHKIGVGIGVEIPDEDSIEALVKKVDVKEAVERLMNEDEDEAKQRRKRVTELGQMAKRAMAEGGSSCVNVTSLIQDINCLSRINKQTCQNEHQSHIS
uniref:UDP-glycosyltransferase 73E1-like n=1 Tax=Erigeron canadensis TaxID=72917 RepID=UPI001CB92E26|nr:UDP-glycosyltransferase 73E1-like [Erigeron canadensis]